MTGSRERILSRIRRAAGAAAGVRGEVGRVRPRPADPSRTDAGRDGPHPADARRTDAAPPEAGRIGTAPTGLAATRAYRTESDLDPGQLLSRFVERVEDYGATVRRCGDEELPGVLARAAAARRGQDLGMLGAGRKEDGRQEGGTEVAGQVTEEVGEHGIWRLAVPPDIPAAWIEGAAVLVDDPANPLSHAELDRCYGVLTGCALAVAETGTIVLDGGTAQGRRVLSLLPDYHLCVVRAGQIVGSVPEALRGLAGTVRGAESPLTFISGPSATSDIELSRVEGVHGPRTLEVVVVGEPG